MKRKKKKNVVPVMTEEKRNIEAFISMLPEQQKKLIYGIHYTFSCGDEYSQYAQKQLDILMSDTRSKRIIEFMGDKYLDISEEDKYGLAKGFAEIGIYPLENQ